MAGINSASRYQEKTSELLKARRKSEKFINKDWSWDGVSSIIVSTLTDPTIGNYNPNGANRYGNPTEVEDTNQIWPVTRMRSWTKTIDKTNYQDTLAIRKPAKYLAQATKNVLVPEMDTYIFQTITTAGEVAGRDNIVADTATSSSNAYSNFLTINGDITDNEAPEEGRQAAMTVQYYNYLKQSGYVLASDKAYADRKSGSMGEVVDGDEIVIVPSSRMPTSTDLIISHPAGCVGPEKLIDYTLHENPQGISGYLLEYLHRYDAIFDLNKTKMIGIHKTA